MPKAEDAARASGGYVDAPAGEYATRPQGFGPPTGGFIPPGGPMTPGSGHDVNTTLPLVLSIASVLLFCDPLLGLPAIVFAVQARSARNMGAFDVARRRAKVALVLGCAGIGLGFLGEVFALARWYFLR